MKKLIALLVIVGMFTAVSSFAGQQGPGQGQKFASANKSGTTTESAKESPAKAELELKGKITKSEEPTKKDPNVKETVFSIDTADYGKLVLPNGKKVKLDEFIDKDVVVKAKVTVKEKKGKKDYKVKEVQSVKPAPAAAQ